MVVVTRRMRRFLFAALLLLLACTTTPTDCTGADDRDSCIVTLAAERGDPELCSTLDENTQVWCLTEVASTLDDETICDRITDERSSTFCKRDIYIARQDSEACATLVGEAKNDCYYEIARAREEWLTCLPMDPGERREKCIDRAARATDDPYGCLRLDERNPRRQPCIYVTSVRGGTHETCAELVDSTLRSLCYTSIATDAEAAENCTGMPVEYKEFCESQFE